MFRQPMPGPQTVSPPGQRRALLAWEFGAGYTHVANILAIAERLRGAGIACLATLHDLRRAHAFTALGIPVVQNHVWPQGRRWSPQDRERPHVGFLDVLGNLGFGEADWVAGALAHYDGLFDLFSPDIVLAENAYGAQLAARGRVPAIAFGFGEYLPVIEGGRFVFPSADACSWAADDILPGLNAGLARTGRPPLSSLEEMFDSEAAFPFGPAAFDGNGPLRATSMPAHVPGFRPGVLEVPGDDIFVYLQGTGTNAPAVMAALLTLKRPARAHMPDLGREERDLLNAAGVRPVCEPIPMSDIVAGSRCVLHHGGVGLTAACLAAGLPQVVLSKHPDHRRSGDFVAREGLGFHHPFATATTPWIVEAARRAYGDDTLQSTCRARASEFAPWFAYDPAERVAQEACRLLGLSDPAVT